MPQIAVQLPLSAFPKALYTLVDLELALREKSALALAQAALYDAVPLELKFTYVRISG